MIKTGWWTDGDLLRWPLAKRVLYLGMVQISDDSGCLEDDAFALKLALFPSPLDSEITVDAVDGWLRELVEAGKLATYKVNGKPYLFLCNFHRHQRLRSPAAPEIPLPVWIAYEPATVAHRSGVYTVGTPYGDRTDTVPPPYPAGEQEGEGEGEKESPLTPPPGEPLLLEDVPPPRTPEQDFAEWWEAYPRREDRGKSLSLYLSRRKRKESAAMLLKAAQNYAQAVKESETPPGFVKRATTFLSLTSTYCEECAERVPTLTDHRGDRRIDLVEERVPNDV
jgi:hypothetical protein